MDYEKKYKEALERAKEIIKDYESRHLTEKMSYIKEDMECIFPELAESEDEMIRKEIEYIIQTYRDNCINEGSHRFDDCLAWLEKQKHIEWSEEDEQYLLVCKNALAKYQISDKWDADIISKWLESKLKSLCPQPKQEWSEEEKQKLDKICKVILWAADSHAFGTTSRLIGDKEAIELEDFIHTIVKPQPKQEGYTPSVNDIHKMMALNAEWEEKFATAKDRVGLGTCMKYIQKHWKD